MNRHTTTVMGSQVAYWESGGGAGRPLVLVHGIRGNHRALTGMTGHLSGRRLIMLDLPGHGESTPMRAEHNLENYARFLEAFCERLGLPVFDLWAHSFGANLALVFVAQTKQPPSRLVLVSPAMDNADWTSQVVRAFYWCGRRLPAPLGRYLLANPMYALFIGWLLIRTRNRRLSRKLYANERRNLPEFRVGVVTQAFASFLNSNPWALVPHCARPTLVIGGRLDALVPANSLARLSNALPDGRLVMLDDTGHLAPLEEPERLAVLTQDFLD